MRVLCGVRGVRDCRIRSGSENAAVVGGSAYAVVFRREESAGGRTVTVWGM